LVEEEAKEMKTKLIRALGLLFAVCLLMTTLLVSQSSSLAQSLIRRSLWEMNLGQGIQAWGFVSPYYGWEGEYDYATIPSPDDPGWIPAPDPDIIGYVQFPSTLWGVYDCRIAGEFTYFRTFVSIPSNVEVTEFVISTLGVDDGIRVTILNSSYPGGLVTPGSYVFLGATGSTADLKDYVVSGEVNTVIITHVDDCSANSTLDQVDIVLNGEVVPVLIEVGIDIKPGSYPNCLNINGHGVVPVAILGSNDFDVTQIDVSTLTFAGLAVRIKGNGTPQCSVEDVSGDFANPEGAPDGHNDLVCKFVDDANAWSPVNDTAAVTGDLYDGTHFEGVDKICLTPRLAPYIEQPQRDL
jgi:hypothetical protein